MRNEDDSALALQAAAHRVFAASQPQLGARIREAAPDGGPYTIPLDGPTGRVTAAAGWSPWRPAHIHPIVSADGHEPLVTQLFIDTSDYLDSDVASAVKPELIVHPEPKGDGELALSYDFVLAPARTAAMRRTMAALKVAIVGGQPESVR